LNVRTPTFEEVLIFLQPKPGRYNKNISVNYLHTCLCVELDVDVDKI